MSVSVALGLVRQRLSVGLYHTEDQVSNTHVDWSNSHLLYRILKVHDSELGELFDLWLAEVVLEDLSCVNFSPVLII